MNAEKTGALIREAREEKNLSQQQLAEQLHITRTTVSKWENGRGMPDVSLLERLAEVLELSVSELVCGEQTAGEPEAALRDVIRISGKNRRRDRRLIAALAAAVLILLVFVISGNRWKTYGTLAEAEQAAGFRWRGAEEIVARIDATIPLFRARTMGFRAKQGVIEVYWQVDGNTCSIRKGIGARDVSEDHRRYADVQLVEHYGTNPKLENITIKGENGYFSAASWAFSGYSYALQAEFDGSGWSYLDILNWVERVSS